MNNQIENPMVVGVDEAYAKTFKDDPEETITCPHCKAVWEKYTSKLDEGHADWISGNFDIASRNGDKYPLANGFCYACALETAAQKDVLEYCEKEKREELAAWIVGISGSGTVLQETHIDFIISSERMCNIPFPIYEHNLADITDSYVDTLLDFISDNGSDGFREWRTFERGE